MKLFRIFLLILIFTGCKQAPKATLAWRWSFAGVTMPNVAGFYDSIGNGSYDPGEIMQRFFLDYKLILRKDNTCDIVMFQKYLHGSWAYNEQLKALTITDESEPATPLVMQVDSLSPVALWLKMDSTVLNKLIPPFMWGNKGFSYFRQAGRFTFYLTADNERYTNEKTDPYSKPNNVWRLKPAKPEDENAVLQRVQNHLQFYRLFMNDVVDRNKHYISLHSFRTPLILNKESIGLKSYDDARDAWDESFYDTLQARQGYKILYKAIIKGIKPGDSDDRFKNSVKMLEELIENTKAKPLRP